MNSADIKLSGILNKLNTFSLSHKIFYLESLLFQLTIASRGIWSDDQSPDDEKVKALKWLNELSHRIWNIRFDMLRGGGCDGINQLYENIKFYGDQSSLLRSHLAPTILSAFEILKQKPK